MWEEISKVLISPKFYFPILTLILVILIINVSNKTIKKIFIKDATKIETKRRNTIVVLASNIIKYVVIIFGVLFVLSIWGIDVSSILAGLGIAGVVAGLALQDALKDIIMGCNIILDNYYVVGDYVTYGDFTGEVVEFGLKNTKIKDSLNHVLVIGNRNIDKVINHSQGKFLLPINVNVAYEENIDKVFKVLTGIIPKLCEVTNVNDAQFIGLSKLDESAVVYKLLIQCAPKNQYQVERDINKIIKMTLDKERIKIPYNQVEVHRGS